MTSHGQPDGPRSARYILKDYVNGRLLYSHPPPGVDLALFNQFTSVESSQCDDDDSVGPVTQEAAGTDKVRVYCETSCFTNVFCRYHEQRVNSTRNISDK